MGFRVLGGRQSSEQGLVGLQQPSAHTSPTAEGAETPSARGAREPGGHRDTQGGEFSFLRDPTRCPEAQQQAQSCVQGQGALTPTGLAHPGLCTHQLPLPPGTRDTGAALAGLPAQGSAHAALPSSAQPELCWLTWRHRAGEQAGKDGSEGRGNHRGGRACSVQGLEWV